MTESEAGETENMVKSDSDAENNGPCDEENNGVETIIVKAKHTFKAANNDELSFRKNSFIVVTQKLEGGWWEGTLNNKTGWFPSNYVIEVKNREKRSRGISPINLKNQQLNLPKSTNKVEYRKLVLQGLVSSESEHIQQLNVLLTEYLLTLEEENVLQAAELRIVRSNLELIVQVQLNLLDSLEDNSKKESIEQKIGHKFMEIAPRFRDYLQVYCENHPSAVEILEKNRHAVEGVLSSKSTSFKEFLTNLSLPFRHIGKYPVTLQELERNLEDGHPDRGDTQRASSVYGDLVNFCAAVRKQKEMQNELLNSAILEGISNGNGTTKLKSFGEIFHMGTVSVCVDENENFDDRCLVLFPSTLLVLEITRKLNAYKLKADYCLEGAQVKKLDASEKSQVQLHILLKSAEIVGVKLTFARTEELNVWLEALQNCRAVTMDESCNIISPTLPSHYATVQGDLSPATKPKISVLPSPGKADVIKKSSTLPARLQHDLQMVIPDYSTNLDPENQAQTSNTDTLFGGYSLRPHAPHRANFAVDLSKNVIKMRRRETSEDQDDATVLNAVEAYRNVNKLDLSTGNFQGRKSQSMNGSFYGGARISSEKSPKFLVAEDEKILTEEYVDGTLVLEERSLVDTVYLLRDQVSSLRKIVEEVQSLSKTLEREQRLRKRIEEVLRKKLKD